MQAQTPQALWLVPDDGNLVEYLDRYLKLADSAVTRILEGRRVDVPINTVPVDLAFREAAKLVRGGKKLRGALIALGFSIAGGQPELRDAIVEASIGYEFLHNALLIHDDIMDRAVVRRSAPTAWEAFATSLQERGEHYGVAQAINVGDMMAYWLPALIAQNAFRPERVVEAIRIISHAVQTTVIGQMLDVDPDITIFLPSDDRLMDIIRFKTAVYTIVAPLQIGAVLGNMGPGTREYGALERFGLPVGMAFQLQDDILGVYGSERELGKSVTSDMSEGKKTLLFWELHRRLDGAEQRRFLSVFGKQEVSESDMAWVQERGRQTGALGAVEGRARELTADAKKAIPEITANVRAQQLLESVADFVIKRQN